MKETATRATVTVGRGGESRSSSSCAACKLLKRRCGPQCIFAPHFRSDESKKFAKVHKVFGASNVSKILSEVPIPQRDDAVTSLAYEADARLRDPVYGCIASIAALHCKMAQLRSDLALVRTRLARIRAPPTGILPPLPPMAGWFNDELEPLLPDLGSLLGWNFEDDLVFLSEQRFNDDLSRFPFGL